MADPRAVNYIKEHLAQGHSISKLKKALKDQGWKSHEINAAAETVQQHLDDPVNSSHASMEPHEEKKHNLGTILMVLVALIIIISSVVYFGFGDEVTIDRFGQDPSADGLAQNSNCGEDFDCFLSAADSCSPATVTFSGYFDFGDLNQYRQWQLEIIGETKGKCELVVVGSEIEVEYSRAYKDREIANGRTEDEIDAVEDNLNIGYEAQSGISAICKYRSQDILGILEKWSLGLFPDDDITIDNCEGDYLNLDI